MTIFLLILLPATDGTHLSVPAASEELGYDAPLYSESPFLPSDVPGGTPHCVKGNWLQKQVIENVRTLLWWESH